MYFFKLNDFYISKKGFLSEKIQKSFFLDHCVFTEAETKWQNNILQKKINILHTYSILYFELIIKHLIKQFIHYLT